MLSNHFGLLKVLECRDFFDTLKMPTEQEKQISLETFKTKTMIGLHLYGA